MCIMCKTQYLFHLPGGIDVDDDEKEASWIEKLFGAPDNSKTKSLAEQLP